MTKIPSQLPEVQPLESKPSFIGRVSSGTKTLISSALKGDIISKGAKKISKGTRDFTTGAMLFAQTLVPSATTTGVLGTAGAAMTIESCTKKSDDVITPIKEEPKEPTNVSKLKPYMSVVASDPKLGIMQAYVDPQGTLLPTKVNLKLNTTDGVVESKLRKAINTHFGLAVKMNGGSFNSLQEFISFVDKNKDLFKCEGIVGVESFQLIDGNSGGGYFPISSLNSIVSGEELDVLDILKKYSDKLVTNGKPGFLVEATNPTTNEKILSTKSAAKVVFQIYILDEVNGPETLFYLYFTPSGIQFQAFGDEEKIDISFSTQTGI